MTLSLAFVRTLFIILSVIFSMALTIGTLSPASIWTYLAGGGLGLAIGGLLIFFDLFLRRFHLRSLNSTIIGLFIGYLMALALVLILNTFLKLCGVETNHLAIECIKVFLFLFATYLGVTMTVRASDQLAISIPFIKLMPEPHHSKDILVDLSALGDPRLIDLAASGLLDKRLILPRFFLKELQQQKEHEDELLASRAKRSLEVAKKLEMLPDLHLRYQDTDFGDGKESSAKLLRLARVLNADVLSADFNKIQGSSLEGVRIINLHTLSLALKPHMQKGEILKIKIQRYGKKEELQGVGYLEDGTMVVVNGGGNYIGETITARVLSVKHTASGRLIFCNIADDSSKEESEDAL